MRHRSILLAACGVALVANLAIANPSVRVRYVDGVTFVELEGSYPQSRYTVYRSVSPEGAQERLTQVDVLCIGTCYVQDWTAEPGQTYWYRFDLVLADGSLARFGPYAVTIASELAGRARLSITPNPVRRRARVDIRLAGLPGDAPVRVDATVLDVQGRVRRTLLKGDVPRGLTKIEWNGDDDAGRRLAAGTYFVRVRSVLGEWVLRVLRVS